MTEFQKKYLKEYITLFRNEIKNTEFLQNAVKDQENTYVGKNGKLEKIDEPNTDLYQLVKTLKPRENDNPNPPIENNYYFSDRFCGLVFPGKQSDIDHFNTCYILLMHYQIGLTMVLSVPELRSYSKSDKLMNTLRDTLFTAEVKNRIQKAQRKLITIKQENGQDVIEVDELLTSVLDDALRSIKNDNSSIDYLISSISLILATILFCLAALISMTMALMIVPLTFAPAIIAGGSLAALVGMGFFCYMGHEVTKTLEDSIEAEYSEAQLIIT